MRRWMLATMLGACGGGSGGAAIDAPTGGTDGAVVDVATYDAPPCVAGVIRGFVTSAGAPVAGARVTLLSPDETLFREVRSGVDGAYAFTGLLTQPYTVGASRRDLEYREQLVELAATCVEQDFDLGPETETGFWEVLGDPGETFGGTNSGVLLPDGRVMFCHDTLDPVVIDPVSLTKDFPPPSPRLQGCHAVTVRPDGLVIYVGGADVPVYGPGTRQVKTFDPATFDWVMRPDMNDYRWYPTLVPLADGELLAIGGGGADNPVRVDTSETMDPDTFQWTPAGDVALGNEVSPIVLLYTGEALMTHRPPQLYNAATRAWRLAGDFVQSNRMSNGDHADHELQLLPDGRVAAFGFKNLFGTDGIMLELYDPETDTWTLGDDMPPLRSRASTLMLPDGRVLVMGGAKENDADPTPTNEWGQLALTDLWDPQTGWRRLSDMNLAREYHAMPILVPDGRVFITGGEGQPGNEPPASVLEAFTPPYLLRGPRPVMGPPSSTTLARGDTVMFSVDRGAPTEVVMMGTNATTHFMDSGNGRYLSLDFTRDGDTVTAEIPTDPARAVLGWYLLFVLVDDIPSAAAVVRITE